MTQAWAVRNWHRIVVHGVGLALLTWLAAVYLLGLAPLDVNLILRDLEERQAMLIGFAAFVLLIPLTATSTAGWQRRLGKRWRTLHRLVYVAVILSVWHYLWLDRDSLTAPILYALIVGGLLALRLVRRAAQAHQHRSL